MQVTKPITLDEEAFAAIYAKARKWKTTPNGVVRRFLRMAPASHHRRGRPSTKKTEVA